MFSSYVTVQEVCKIEQEMLVSEFWHWFVRSGQNISLEATKAMTVDYYATKGFPVCLLALDSTLTTLRILIAF